MRGILLGPALASVLAANAQAGEILVAAAASLREPLGEISREFEESHPGTRVVISFGASSLLAAQIRAGAPVHVYLGADELHAEALERSGHLQPGSRTDLAGNRLVVLRRIGLEAPLGSAQDLLRPEIRRIALPSAAVPLGRYARQWLADRNVLEGLQGRIVQTPDARATLAAVDLGHVDAAPVYATDAALAQRARVAFDVPADLQPEIVYVAALTARGGRSETARAFLSFLLGPGARLLEDAGFLGPENRAEGEAQ